MQKKLKAYKRKNKQIQTRSVRQMFQARWKCVPSE